MYYIFSSPHLYISSTLAPFARIPPESEKLVEQYDAIWDDGVAPEVTLDFDCQHISSGEGLAMWVVSY